MKHRILLAVGAAAIILGSLFFLSGGGMVTRYVVESSTRIRLQSGNSAMTPTSAGMTGRVEFGDDAGDAKAEVEVRPPNANPQEAAPIHFKSTGVTALDTTHWRMRGDLLLNGHTAPIEVALDVSEEPRVDGAGRLVRRVAATTELKAQDFGVPQPGSLNVAVDVVLVEDGIPAP